MAEIILDYGNIIDSISIELNSIWRELSSIPKTDPNYKNYENVVPLMQIIKAIEVSDEELYVKKRENNALNNGTLYVVVKFNPGPINFASSVVPIALICLGTENKIRPAQLLLGVFASEWTTKNLCQGITDGNGVSVEISNALQVWNTPEVSSNFNVFEKEFRSLYRLTGNIVIGPKAVRLGTLTYIYDETAYNSNPANGCETVNVMSFGDSYTASLDSQPFGNTNGFVKSEVNFSTYVFTVSTFLLDNHLSASVLAVRGFRNRKTKTITVDNTTTTVIDGISSKFAANDPMLLKLEFTNGFTNLPVNSDSMLDSNDPVKNSMFYGYYKMVDSKIGQELAGIPTLTISFTR